MAIDFFLEHPVIQDSSNGTCTSADFACTRRLNWCWRNPECWGTGQSTGEALSPKQTNKQILPIFWNKTGNVVSFLGFPPLTISIYKSIYYIYIRSLGSVHAGMGYNKTFVLTKQSMYVYIYIYIHVYTYIYIYTVSHLTAFFSLTGSTH